MKATKYQGHITENNKFKQVFEKYSFKPAGFPVI